MQVPYYPNNTKISPNCPPSSSQDPKNTVIKTAITAYAHVKTITNKILHPKEIFMSHQLKIQTMTNKMYKINNSRKIHRQFLFQII